MSVKVCELHGITSVTQFYQTVVRALGLPPHFSHNLDALYDSLSTDVEGPIFIYWHQYAVDEQKIGSHGFAQIRAVLEQLADEREDFFIYFD